MSKKSEQLGMLISQRSDAFSKDDLAVKAKAGEVVLKLHVTLIDPNPYQNRRDFDSKEIGLLAESINENGQNQPIGVRKYGDRYQIVFGERRWRACQLTADGLIDVVLRDVSDIDMQYLCYSENRNRNNLLDYETYIGVARLLESGESATVIQKRLVMGKSDYYKYLKFGELPLEIREFLETNPTAITRVEAQDISKIYHEIGDVDMSKVSESLITLMKRYLVRDGIKSRALMVKMFRKMFVTPATRNRVSDNRVSILSNNGTPVGKVIKTDSEYQVTIDTTELPQDRLAEIEAYLASILTVTKPQQVDKKA